jgi:chromosome segregation protein
MRLKSLEIVGFKSFAEPFRIDFKQGISSIVGPNGCGKSNVADAIRWVLGSQNPKQLRADRMESVIFCGSTNRKQLGMAEVTLVFDNTDRTLGLDYDEVSVSRRLFRSGDSEYSINGSTCRLMDVTDLIVDRGLGSTGYWVLESKMIATILSSRPEDRRFLFDEAAGIVKYKIQRHRAELKLAAAGSDLERLSDIIMEVDSTCSSLKKQVSAYNRHRKVVETISAVKEAMIFVESSEIKSRLEEKTRQLDEIGSVVGKETAVLASRNTVLAEARMEFSIVQNRLDEAHRICAELESGLSSNDMETAVASLKASSAETRIAENNARIARERERVHRYSSDIEKLSGEKIELQLSVAKLQGEYAEVSTAVDEQRKALEAAGRTHTDARSARRALEEEVENRRRSYLEQIRRDEARLNKMASLQDSIDSLTDRGSILGRNVTLLLEEQAVLNSSIETLENSLKRIVSLRTATSDEAAGLSGRIAETGKTIAVLKEQAGRVKKLLQESSAENSVSTLIKPLPGMGKAVGAYLDSFHTARPLESITPDLPGEGRRYVVNTGIFKGELPDGATKLTDCVESVDNNELVVSILSHGILAPNFQTAVKWVKDGYSGSVVTTEGYLVRSEGFIRAGIEASSAGTLELSAILEDCEKQLEETAGSIIELEKILKLKNEELCSLAAEAESHRDELRVKEKKLAGVQTMHENSRREFETLKNSLSSAQDELVCLEKTDSAEASGSNSELIAVLDEKRAAAMVLEEETAIKVSGLETSLAEALRKQDSFSYSIRENRSRQKDTADRIEMFTGEAESMNDILEELQRENENAHIFIASLKGSIEALQNQKSVLKTKRGEAESVRNNYSMERNRLMESTSVLEKEVQQVRDRLGKARTILIELETQTASLEEKLEKMEGVCSIPDNPFLGRSAEYLREELESGNAALERVGPVNMLAVTEYEETSERLNYLVEQRLDLENARTSLGRAISEINTEAAQRFKETFLKVRENFRDMFVRLFGGGEGDIVIVEGEDPLEGGVEILARPSGKKLKNVIALSDGEKALTAVALLFSLYLVKPSPFCVLDELDSPFDDSNTDKFVSILRDFSRKTQFIVITHNKRTMEGSDVLYGVTMAEEGVSTITSVSMEEMVH